MNLLKCPKCGHVRSPGEVGTPGRCSACGLVFDKWARRDSFVPPSRRQAEETEEPAWRAALRERLEHVPEHVDANYLYGRAAMLLMFLVWGIRLALMDYRDGEMGSSFMHAILLPIHEAGHVLFMPFGQFLTMLGGSLFQLLLPLIAAATVLWQNRDPFGAALGVWWCGISMMDLAAYIHDAKTPQLTLLGGHTGEDGPHDWIYLLDVFGKVQQSQSYGAIVYWLGVLLMLAGLAWAAGVLWRMRAIRAAA
ncbi:MAG: hypothetical protein Q8O38_17280 [Sulfurimicrobium sp.]|nr:hypothetical protein [Sulfurimicrobium sp.]